MADLRQRWAHVKEGLDLFFRPLTEEDYASLREEKTPSHPLKSVLHDAVATRKEGDSGGLMRWALEAACCDAKPREREEWVMAMNKSSLE